MSRGAIVEKVVSYIISQIVDHPDEVDITLVEEGPEDVVVEVRTVKSDMGRVIGRRGRVARAVRTLAKAAGDEEGLHTGVEFID
jgi:predicted RNA-binding protein YlqC (UPF0109 family)